MASTYTTSLKIQQIANGEQAGTWGSTTNTNWNLMEQAVAGVQTITMSNANYTLSNLNGTLDEARNAVLVVLGTNSGVYQVVAPLVPKTYVISNQTAGGFSINIGGASGSLMTIPNGVTTIVYCDGTNFYSGVNGFSGNSVIAGSLTVSGNIIASSFSGAGTGLTGTASSLSIGGNAATATNATNAVTATSATSATTSTRIANSGGWSVTPSGTTLYFNYNGTNVASLDSSGNFVALANITAYGTP